MNIKYFFIRLQLLTQSPIFISSLTFIIFTLYKICFDPVMLCDDTDVVALYELKTKLITETANYHVATVKYEQYTGLQKELRYISTPRFRDFNTEQLYNSKIQSWRIEKINALNSIHALVVDIKTIQPNFNWTLNK
jgi:hypothetical protein